MPVGEADWPDALQRSALGDSSHIRRLWNAGLLPRFDLKRQAGRPDLETHTATEPNCKLKIAISMVAAQSLRRRAL